MLDPLYDPLKGIAVVPQKYVEMMERQGRIKPIRCSECEYWDDSSEGRYYGGWCFCNRLQMSTSPDFFCADGERADGPTCGPDYCEIGGDTK